MSLFQKMLVAALGGVFGVLSTVKGIPVSTELAYPVVTGLFGWLIPTWNKK